MKKQLLTLGLAVSMIILSAQPLQAKMNKHKSDKGEGRGKKMAALNLTEEQQAQMETIRLTHKKKMIPLQADLETEKVKMQELRMAETPSKKKMSAQIDKIAETKARIDKQKLEMDLEIRGLLTAEQQKIWAKRPMKSGKRGSRNGMDCARGPHSGRGRF